MITFTLKDLRNHRACINGYNKLVCHLSGKTFDINRETHIRWQYDEPIPLATILASNGLDDALRALQACEQSPEFVRACRLYAVWCARQVQHLMTDPRSIAALDVAERHANSLATDAELAAAWAATSDAVWASWDAARAASWAASWAARAAREASYEVWDAWDEEWDAEWDAVRDKQREMFERVFCGDELNTEAIV